MSQSGFPSPTAALSLFSESAAHRAELAVLELDEAREHACVSTVLASASAALVLFTGFAFTLLIASLVWDSPNRAAWLASLCGVYLIGAVIAGWTLSRRLKSWQPLRETHRQLQQDYQCISHLAKPTSNP